MKDKILEKIKQLKGVTVMSYLKFDGVNYQQICKDTYTLIDQAIETNSITVKEYLFICAELKKIADNTAKLREQAEKIFKNGSQIFQFN